MKTDTQEKTVNVQLTLTHFSVEKGSLYTSLFCKNTAVGYWSNHMEDDMRNGVFPEPTGLEEVTRQHWIIEKERRGHGEIEIAPGVKFGIFRESNQALGPISQMRDVKHLTLNIQEHGRVLIIDGENLSALKRMIKETEQ